MYMKKTVYTLLALLIVFAACKKDAAEEVNQFNVKSATYTSGNGNSFTHYYTYDSKGRIKTNTTYHNGVFSSKSEYVYTTGEVRFNSYDSPTATAPSSTHTKPLTAEGFYLEDENGTIYTYNTEGYLIQTHNDLFGYTRDYYYTNGDNTMIIGYDNTTGDTVRFYYDTIPDIKNDGRLIFGKANKHLLLSSTGTNQNFTYENVVDNKNRLIKCTKKQPDGTLYQTIDYTYAD